MSEFTSRQAVVDWLNAHARQTIRIGCAGSTLRIECVTEGIEELDACSADIPYGDLRTEMPGVHVAVTLHDDALSLHVLMGEGTGRRARLSLPLSVPYERLRLAPAGAPEDGDPRAEEPEFSPYELLHFPRAE